jgi:diguanylate cyclase (GGDEF)-like protein
MTWSIEFTPWALVSLLGVLLGVRVVDFLAPRHRESGAKALLALTLAATWWSLFHMAGIVTTSSGPKETLLRLAFGGATVAPAAWLWFAMEVSTETSAYRRWTYGLVAALTGMTLVFNLAYPSSTLLWEGFAPVQWGALVHVAVDPGPWYWLHTALFYVLILTATVILVRHGIRTPGPRLRWVLALLAAWLVIIANTRQLTAGTGTPYWEDLTAPVTVAAALLLGWGLLRYQLVHLGPVERSVVVERMRDAVVVLDRKGQLVDLNKTSETSLGLHRYGEVPEILTTLLDPAAAAEVDTTRVPLPALLEGGMQERMFEVTVTSLGTQDDPGRSILVLRDVTDREIMDRRLKENEEKLTQANADLERLAHTDALTNLANRRHFMQSLEREIERSRRYDRALSLILLDLDHFKQVNDRYGHSAGDGLLVAAAEAIREVCRDIDLPGRLGGEEFAILLPETDLEGARIVAERARLGLARQSHVVTGFRPFRVTASFGVASLAQGTETSEALLQLADRALYRAKDQGRNRVSVA